MSTKKKVTVADKKDVVKDPIVRVRIVGRSPKRFQRPEVVPGASTMEPEDKTSYTTKELNEFRSLITQKLDEARNDYDLFRKMLSRDNNDTQDTYNAFKGMEDGSEVLSREETSQLAARQEKFIKHLEDALLRIRNKTYGICRVTGRLISKERLRLVPHATTCVEAKANRRVEAPGSVTGQPRTRQVSVTG